MEDKEFASQFEKLARTVLEEHRKVFEKEDLEGIKALSSSVAAAKKVFVMGVGREGLAAKSFAMRLMHLGKDAHYIWEDTCPGMGRGDLFIVVNGCGEISHINTVTQNTRRTGAKIFVITGQRDSTASKMADEILFVPAAVFKGTDKECVPSEQPMGNLFEQHLFMLSDIAVMMMEKELGTDPAKMEARHRNIE
ncbi:MAG: SIS domain-containing protein [Succinivibrio sp.]